MNTITIAGALGRDAELRHTSSGDAVLSFSVADSQGRDKPTVWWSCSLWGRRAESLAPYLTKSQQVTVAGTVSEREWTDREGNKRKSMEVRVTEIALQGGKRDEQARPAPAPQRPAPASAGSQYGVGVHDDDDPDSIPF